MTSDSVNVDRRNWARRAASVVGASLYSCLSLRSLPLFVLRRVLQPRPVVPRHIACVRVGYGARRCSARCGGVE